MVKGKMVKIRFRRYFAEQTLWVFVGKILEFTENWLKIEGKGIAFFSGRGEPADIDDETRELLLPRDSIAYVRLLPDDFDITDIKTIRKGVRYFIQVKNAPDTTLGEIGDVG